MYTLRRYIFTALFWLWGALLALAMILTSPLGLRVLNPLKRTWLRGNMALARLVLGIRYRVIGMENLPAGPCIFAMKHQSAWDTFMPGLLLPNPGYVMKQELLNVPLFGWVVQRWPVIALDRQQGRKALRLLVERGKDLMAERAPQLMIFPEGTRRAIGEETSYHIGVAALYEALEVPLVPVALNSGLYWGRGFSNFAPGCITLSILPAIPAGLPKRDLLQRLESEIEAEVARLVADPNAPALAERHTADQKETNHA